MTSFHIMSYHIEDAQGVQLSRKIEALFDALLIQLDSIAMGQNFDVEIPLEAGTDFMYLESTLDVGQCLCWIYGINRGQPGKGAFGVTGLNGQSEVLDLVATWTKGGQAFEDLGLTVIVIPPYFVRFNRVCVAGASAYFANIPGFLEGGELQTIPGSRTDVGTDVAVPTGTWHQFDRKFH